MIVHMTCGAAARAWRVGVSVCGNQLQSLHGARCCKAVHHRETKCSSCKATRLRRCTLQNYAHVDVECVEPPHVSCIGLPSTRQLLSSTVYVWIPRLKVGTNSLSFMINITYCGSHMPYDSTRRITSQT